MEQSVQGDTCLPTSKVHWSWRRNTSYTTLKTAVFFLCKIMFSFSSLNKGVKYVLSALGMFLKLSTGIQLAAGTCTSSVFTIPYSDMHQKSLTSVVQTHGCPLSELHTHTLPSSDWTGGAWVTVTTPSTPSWSHGYTAPSVNPSESVASAPGSSPAFCCMLHIKQWVTKTWGVILE